MCVLYVVDSPEEAGGDHKHRETIAAKSKSEKLLVSKALARNISHSWTSLHSYRHIILRDEPLYFYRRGDKGTVFVNLCTLRFGEKIVFMLRAKEKIVCCQTSDSQCLRATNQKFYETDENWVLLQVIVYIIVNFMLISSSIVF